MIAARINQLVEQAFEYRGYVTVARHDGSQLVGFIYHRDAAHIELFDELGTNRVTIGLAEIADIVLTGDDAAARAHQRWAQRVGRLEARDTSAWGEWEARPTLILVGLPIELRGIAPVLGSDVHRASVAGRIGDDRVIARAVGVGGGAAHVVAAERPRLVISCGFAGALHASLSAGDLVLASAVRDEHGDTVAAPDSALDVARNALSPLRPVEGELLCSARIAASRAEKRALARPGRLAIDLESWAAARAAARWRIPWLALRVVLDPMEVDLPSFAGEVRAAYVVPALRHALGGPRAVLELAQFGIRTSIALRSLRRAMQRLLPALAQLGNEEVRP
jgi:hypothetical protein